MAEVLSPPSTSQSPSPHNAPSPQPPTPHVESPEQMQAPASILSPQPRIPRARATERVPSYARSRMSQYSVHSQHSSRSRPGSNAFPAFQSSLSYALVRDFAYPPFHPMHYGPPPSPLSGTTTPGSDFGGRRMSDPMDMWNPATSRSGPWAAGPWGGDGMMADEGADGESLPATSFALEQEDDDVVWGPKGKHRKSKSYANMSDFERGRRRESGGGGAAAAAAAAAHRRSGAGPAGASDMFYFAGPQQDPAGVDSLRMSRSGFGSHRRDSHLAAATLPSRSFHHSQEPIETPLDSTSSFPLDTLQRHRSPASARLPDPADGGGATSTLLLQQQQQQRVSMGPEDEELYSGPSIALYDFEPENGNELPLREGQEIMVSYRHGQGWLVAEDPQTGEQGLVPEEYVRLVRDLDMEQWYEEDDDDEGNDRTPPDLGGDVERDGNDDDDDGGGGGGGTDGFADGGRGRRGSADAEARGPAAPDAGGGGGGLIDHHDGEGLEMRDVHGSGESPAAQKAQTAAAAVTTEGKR